MQRDNPAVDAGVIALSQAQLAEMMGISRQTLSTLLDRLEARGIISIGFRSIRASI
jgi:DNA-binding transcriptional regulator LsrR (DeoR family)